MLPFGPSHHPREQFLGVVLVRPMDHVGMMITTKSHETGGPS